MAFVQFGFTTHVKTIQAKRFYKKKKKKNLCRKKLQNIKQSFLGLIEHFQSWNRMPVNRHRYVSTFWVSEITLGTMNPLTCFISFIPFFNLFFCIFLKKKEKEREKTEGRCHQPLLPPAVLLRWRLTFTDWSEVLLQKHEFKYLNIIWDVFDHNTVSTYFLTKEFKIN